MQNIFLYLYTFSLSFEGYQIFDVDFFSLPKFFAVLYLFAFLTRFKKFFVLNRNFSYIWPIFLYYVIFTLVSVYNTNHYSQNIFLPSFILNVLMFSLILNHSRHNYLILDRALISFSVGVAIVAMLMLLGVGLEVDSESRETFMVSGKNELAMKITGALMVFLILLIKRNEIIGLGKFLIRKIYLILLIPIMFYAVLNSGSRTAVLTFFLCIFVWFLSEVIGHEGKKSFRFVKSFLWLSIVLVITLFFTSQSEVVVNRFFGGDGISTRELGGRVIIWEGYYNLLLQNVFFGYGLPGFELEAFQIFGAVWDPHNSLLKIMLYTGLVGLFVFLIFFQKIVMATYGLLMKSNLLLPSLLFVVYLGFFFSLQALTDKFCWFVLAYIVGTKLWSPKSRHYFKHDKEPRRKSSVVV